MSVSRALLYTNQPTSPSTSNCTERNQPTNQITKMEAELKRNITNEVPMDDIVTPVPELTPEDGVLEIQPAPKPKTQCKKRRSSESSGSDNNNEGPSAKRPKRSGEGCSPRKQKHVTNKQEMEEYMEKMHNGGVPITRETRFFNGSNFFTAKMAENAKEASKRTMAIQKYVVILSANMFHLMLQILASDTSKLAYDNVTYGDILRENTNLSHKVRKQNKIVPIIVDFVTKKLKTVDTNTPTTRTTKRGFLHSTMNDIWQSEVIRTLVSDSAPKGRKAGTKIKINGDIKTACIHSVHCYLIESALLTYRSLQDKAFRTITSDHETLVNLEYLVNNRNLVSIKKFDKQGEEALKAHTDKHIQLLYSKDTTKRIDGTTIKSNFSSVIKYVIGLGKSVFKIDNPGHALKELFVLPEYKMVERVFRDDDRTTFEADTFVCL